MRIAIVGAGAIGGWLGVRLAAAGHDVGVLARGATLEALRSGPWTLEHAGGRLEAVVRASDDPGELGQHGLVVLAVKGPAIASVAASTAALLAPDGALLPAINGVPWWFTELPAGRLGTTRLDSVDPAGAIARELPVDRIVGAVAHVSARVVEAGVVRQVAGNGLIIGEPDGAQSPRLTMVADLLAQAGIDVTSSTQIRRDIWYKLWGNMTINPIAALTGATADVILDEPLVETFVRQIMSEAQMIGEAIDCAIEEDPAARNAVTRKLGAFRPSMLEDAEAGRVLETGSLLEAPREIARSLDVPTPNIDALCGIMRIFRNQGRKTA